MNLKSHNGEGIDTGGYYYLLLAWLTYWREWHKPSYPYWLDSQIGNC